MSTHFWGEGNIGSPPEYREFPNGNDEPRRLLRLNVYFDNPVPTKGGDFEDRGGFWAPVEIWHRDAAHWKNLYQKGKELDKDCYRELTRLLRPLEREPDVVEHVSSLDMMLTLVGAGYGVGFITATRVAASPRPDVVIRPLAMDSAIITTYLLRPTSESMPVSVERFIARLRAHSGD